MLHLTIIDIAQKANVSVSTVSRVINDHPDVSLKTKKKILKIIKETGYIPNKTAQSLKLDSARAVGVIIKGISNPFFSNIIKEIERYFYKRHYSVIIRHVEQGEKEIDAGLSVSRERKPKGIIFLGGVFDDDTEKLKTLNIPFVMITTTLFEKNNIKNFSSVTVDDREEAFLAVDHICLGGHKNIGAIAFSREDRSISRLRLEGYKKALKKNKIAYDENLVSYGGVNSMKAGYEATRHFVKSSKSIPTAIFCVSDLLAIGVCRFLHDKGFKVPEDISVVGFDGIDMGQFLVPSLTTMKQPDERMVKDAVSVLLDSMEHGLPSKHIVYSTKLIVGESFKNLT